MKTFNLYKAQGVRDEIESVTIIFDRPISDPTDTYRWEQDWRTVLEKEGRQLADALFQALPGGVIDTLLIELLDRKRSLLAIPHEVTVTKDGN